MDSGPPAEHLVVGEWVWLDGTPFEYTKWRQHEPNNWDGEEDCGAMVEGGQWNDMVCGKANRFICVFEPGAFEIPVEETGPNSIGPANDDQAADADDSAD